MVPLTLSLLGSMIRSNGIFERFRERIEGNKMKKMEEEF
jgi:hypothetical protein